MPLLVAPASRAPLGALGGSKPTRRREPDVVWHLHLVLSSASVGYLTLPHPLYRYTNSSKAATAHETGDLGTWKFQGLASSLVSCNDTAQLSRTNAIAVNVDQKGAVDD